ncbi:MAG: hypothetical protein K0R93_680 [Anaerosolibacter sp.]|uniref:radical SAM/SPASM domain-containing protein n=1 Tax=Anaerosolibacter sp. TaxID=1872527 RepID=UPI00263A3B86|nr:radical SAM protein [Anaerosolibacter sp.]MDF2545782.1 hypothetical protein [Anaerosolibacter sp.]
MIKNANNLHEIKIEVTQKCPLNCMHCSSEANISKIRKLTEESVASLLNEASKMGVNSVVFSGGEPLEWEPLIRSLKLCSNLGIDTSVYTTCFNFYLDESLFYEFINSGIRNVVVSLFGANAKEHEKITRIHGSFDKTIAGIKKLKENDINIGVHFVAMRPNWRQLAGVVSLIEELRVKKISILRFVPHGRGEIVKDVYNLNRDELKELKKEILRLRENKEVMIRLGSPFNILSVDSHVDCLAGIDKIIIGSDGLVYPCDAFKNVTYEGRLGSIYEGSLSEIWNESEYLNDVRKMIHLGLGPVCSQCKNCSLCKGGCLAQKIIRLNEKTDVPDPDCLEGKGGKGYGDVEQIRFEI